MEEARITTTDPAMMGGLAEAAGAPPPPAVPSKGPVDWVRKNLFSSVGNSVLTVIFLLMGFFILRWLLDLIFSDERNWASVWTNIRLLFAYNYPAEQFGRIWFSLGAVLAAIGLTLAAVDTRLTVGLRKLLGNLTALGAGLVVLGLLASAAGDSARVWLLVGGVAFVAIGVGTNRYMALDEENDRRIHCSVC